jgi:hypothetical protein
VGAVQWFLSWSGKLSAGPVASWKRDRSGLVTTTISEVYDAFRDANGVSEEKARKAAEAIGQFDTRFKQMKVSVETLNGWVMLTQWQLIAVLAGVATLLLQAFF